MDHTNIPLHRWVVQGSLENPELDLGSLSGNFRSGERKVTLNLEDASIFRFNESGAQGRNLSEWIDFDERIISSLKVKGEDRLVDSDDINKRLEEDDIRFCIR